MLAAIMEEMCSLLASKDSDKLRFSLYRKSYKKKETRQRRLIRQVKINENGENRGSSRRGSGAGNSETENSIEPRKHRTDLLLPISHLFPALPALLPLSATRRIGFKTYVFYRFRKRTYGCCEEEIVRGVWHGHAHTIMLKWIYGPLT